jgi:hypothetical protein
MLIKVIHVQSGRNFIQNTKELKNRNEATFMEYLNKNKKANILDYKILAD